MKRTLLLASFVSLSFAASAQFTKGQKVLSGSFSFSRFNNPDPSISADRSYSSVSFSPSYAWFVSPTKLVAVKLLGSYFQNKQNYMPSPYVSGDKGYSIGAGYYVQKLKPIGNDFFLFAELGGNVNYKWEKWDTQNTSSSTTEIKGYGVAAYVTPGLGYKITSRLIADITLNNIAYLNFNHSKSDYTSAGSTSAFVTKTDAFSIGSGLEKNALSNVGIGIRWIMK